MALVEGEQAKGRDAIKTMEVALERLGDPETLRTNFMDSLSRLDRAYGKAGKFFEKRPDESSVRFALRGCGLFALGISLFIMALFVPTIVGITWLKGPDPGVMVFLPVFGLFIALYSTSTVFWGLLFDARAKTAKVKKEWGLYTAYGCVMVVLSILSGAVCMSIGHAFLQLALGNNHSQIYMFYAAAGVTVSGATLAVIAAWTIGELIIRPRIYNGIPGWPYRDVV